MVIDPDRAVKIDVSAASRDWNDLVNRRFTGAKRGNREVEHRPGTKRNRVLVAKLCKSAGAYTWRTDHQRDLGRCAYAQRRPLALECNLPGIREVDYGGLIRRICELQDSVEVERPSSELQSPIETAPF
jgi:hypothetical protein